MRHAQQQYSNSTATAQHNATLQHEDAETVPATNRRRGTAANRRTASLPTLSLTALTSSGDAASLPPFFSPCRRSQVSQVGHCCPSHRRARRCGGTWASAGAGVHLNQLAWTTTAPSPSHQRLRARRRKLRLSWHDATSVSHGAAETPSCRALREQPWRPSLPETKPRPSLSAWHLCWAAINYTRVNQ